MMAYKTQFNRTKRKVYAVLFFFFLAGAVVAQKKSASSKSSFTAQLINIENAANATFSYNTTLHNGSRESRIYDLNAQIPDGWSVAFRVEGSQVSSFNIDSNRTQSVTVQITPSPVAKPGKYEIPVTAVSGNDTLKLQLEAVVKGSYALQLSTPTGLLSDEVTEGDEKKIQLVVTNSGTIALNDISLSAQSPAQWSTTFEPTKIAHLEPGKTENIVATLKVPDKTIAGDYVTTFSAQNSNKSATASFRVTVKTSLLSGWIGILIILLAIGAIYYLIRKYGRR
ncbi:hypothetical protein A9P82_04895 [Arachidicoccus ginsenosidimutans]|uniref:COG1470 family protein n=1 Tax=Arachidicoccus sp. BS20 TaxID=1850526 RepID=UPI0007F115B3|nr:NEW3 domain-containing protein [Arachidicoccus sp. BS20]ANI88679.1 hypothetical protein A9P82_04895 [Arachidicoccus sp. BS20]